jgi:hypothetical protein
MRQCTEKDRLSLNRTVGEERQIGGYHEMAIGKSRRSNTAEETLKQAADSLVRLFLALCVDVTTAQAARTQADTSYARRVYVRTIFAAIEGLTFSMKQVTLADSSIKKLVFSIEEIRFLGDEKGSWKENLHETMLLYARALNPTYQPKFSDHGWGCLQKANKIRDRITHPKDINALEISDQEMATIDKGTEWYLKNAKELLLPGVQA